MTAGGAETPADNTNRMKVFVSYSRDDVAFADQLVLALEDRGFEPILDRHDIDAAENWKARLGALILSSDAVAFVLTDTSAGSPICGWEVETAAQQGKRIVPVVPRDVRAPPPAVLADLNWIHFFATPAVPGSGMFDGLRKLERALRVDLAWLREQTRLSERSAEWATNHAEDRLLRGAALREAQNWLGRAPPDARVPVTVREYLTASFDIEQGRETAARAQLEERERALRDREAAIKAQAKADARLRWVSLASLTAGVALLATAVTGIWYAGKKAVDAGGLRAEIFAQGSRALGNEGDWTSAAMIAVAGGGSGSGSGSEADAWFEDLFNPRGHAKLIGALARAQSSDRRVSQFELSSVLGCEAIFVNGVAAIPDSARYVVVSECDDKDGGRRFLASVFEGGNPAPVQTSELPSAAWEVKPLAGGDQMVVLWQQARAASLWSLSAGKELQVFVGETDWFSLERDLAERADVTPEFRDEAKDIALDEAGRRVLVAHTDGNVRAWRIGKPEEAPVLYPSEAGRYVREIEFDPRLKDGFATSDSEGFISLWRFTEPSAPFANLDVGDTPSDIAWIFGELNYVDGEGVVSPLGYDSGQGLFRGNPRFNGLELFESREGQQPAQVALVAPTPNNRYAAVFSTSGSGDSKIISTASGAKEVALLGEDIFYGSVAFLSAGQLMVTATDEGRVTVRSFPEGFETETLDEFDAYGGTTFRADTLDIGGGLAVALDQREAEARIWRNGKVETIPWFEGLADNFGVFWIGLSPNGRYLTGTTDTDEIGLWPVGESKPIMRFPYNSDYLFLRFHPDSERLLLADSKGITAWRAGEPQPFAKIERSDIYQFAFAPNGERVALARTTEAGSVNTESSERDVLEVWRLGAAEPEKSWELNQDVVGMAWAPDSESVAMSKDADGGAELLLYRPGDGRTDAYTADGNGAVSDIRFSKDGRLMLGVVSPGFALVWMIGSPSPVQKIDIPGAWDWQAEFDPDGRHVIVAGGGRVFRRPLEPLLFSTPAEQVRIVCERARNLGFQRFTPELEERFTFIQGSPTGNPCEDQGHLPPPAGPGRLQGAKAAGEASPGME